MYFKDWSILYKMNCKRKIIGENIGFSTIIDSKFNTCSVYIRFITELSEETVSANAIATECLSVSNKKIPSQGELFDTTAELYGSHIGSVATQKGDAQITGLYASWICSKFTFDGEDIDTRMIEIIHDCIFMPNVQDGSFDKASFKIVQKNIIDDIKSKFNDKRFYAILQAEKAALKGEPASIENTGTLEQAESVTPESAFKAYQNLIRTAQIEIFYVTPEENPAVEKMFRESFAITDRTSCSCKIYNKSPLKAEPISITEEFNINQSKMVFVMKSDLNDKFACDIMSVILGGTPVSKLFANVREKLSLCYYCSCSYNEEKNTLTIDCGVDKANIEKARDEIFRQLNEIVSGNISDDEINSALLTIDDIYTGIGNTPSQCAGWQFEQICSGYNLSPLEYAQKFHEVTKDRIIQAASSFKLDTSYYMLNKEAVQ